MVKFELTLDDIIHFNQHYIKKHGSFFQKNLQWMLMAVFFIVLTIQVYQTTNSILFYAVVAVLALVIVVLQNRITQYFARKAMVTYVKKNPNFIGQRIYEFDDKELRVRVNEYSSSYPYSGISRLEENKYAYYAYVTEASAVIIPKRIAQQPEALQLIEKLKSVVA